MLWALLGAAFTLRDSFIPSEMRTKLDSSVLIQYWDWRTWIIGALVILLVSALEGCYRGHRHYSEIREKAASEKYAELEDEVEKQRAKAIEADGESTRLNTEIKHLEEEVANQCVEISIRDTRIKHLKEEVANQWVEISTRDTKIGRLQTKLHGDPYSR
jgi:predicted RNase H-like nuclease (RuvC/YqgF family)